MSLNGLAMQINLNFIVWEVFVRLSWTRNRFVVGSKKHVFTCQCSQKLTLNIGPDYTNVKFFENCSCPIVFLEITISCSKTHLHCLDLFMQHL